MKLTIYDKYLIDSMVRLYPSAETAPLVEQLIRIGVVDPVRCKILLIRENVAALVKEGNGKIESMYMTAEKMCTSYEYVRKCIYYNKNINLPQSVNS